MFGGLIVRLAISEGETATRSGQMSIPRYRPTIGFLQRSGSYHRRRLASLERRLKRLGCSPVGFGQRTFSRIVQQCRKEKRQTGSRSLLNTGMGLLPLSRLTPGHFGTVTGSPASLHANVKSKAVSSPVRSSACTPTGDAKALHNPVALCMGSIRCSYRVPGWLSSWLTAGPYSQQR